MTNENGRKTKRLSREILGLLLITAVIALFFWGFLYLTANSISETYFTERNLQPSEGQWLTLRAWIRSVSLLSTVILFLVLFLFLLGQKLAYLREIIQGVDALRTHRLEDTIPLREANELTELAEHINFLSETERRLRQQEMALQAERERMIRDLSHDIRTPLTSIVGNTAAILENEDSFSPEQKRRLLEDVNEDAQWLIRMVENLLSITRMSGGQAKIEKDCEAAEEIVGVSVSKFTKRFPAIKVSIEVPDEVLMVPMDATLIRQVIMNLLENAAIHGGNVTQIRVCLSREGTNACFSVSDNGVGIPKERLSTIFNGGLSGVSHNNFDMKKNMGIGLSVCYTIVKAHGGTMTAENLDSGGACFRFYLPLEEGINSEIEG